MQTAFGPILDTPFGTGGDLMRSCRTRIEVRVDFEDGSAAEHFFLGDIQNTDGTAWECCPREFLRRQSRRCACAVRRCGWSRGSSKNWSTPAISIAMATLTA